MEQNQQIISLEDIGELVIFDDIEPNESTPKGEDDDTILDIEGGVTEELEDNPTPPTDIEEDNDKPQPNHFTKVVQDFIKDEIWEDYKVEHGGVEYESLLDLVEKVEVTEELFKGLVETQTQGRISKIQENSIVLDSNLDQTRQQLVKAIASGLKDYQQFLDTYDNVIEPVKNLDLTEERNAIGLVAKFYKEVNGWDDEYISFKLNQHKTNLELEDVAEGIRKEYVSSYEQILANKQSEQQQQEQALVEKEKQAKKEFKQALKEAEYDDPFIAKAIPLLYSKDNGESHWSKEINKRLQEDPQFKIDFAHWLLNSDDYLNKKLAPKKRAEKLKTIDVVSILGAASKKKTPNVETDDKDSDILDIPGMT